MGKNMKTADYAQTLLVILTAAQADQVEWALGPMDDFWQTAQGAHDRDGAEYPLGSIPRLEPEPSARIYGGTTQRFRLWLSRWREINEDLLYRLEVQLQDMARTERTAEARGHAKSAWNAALRIRSRLKHSDLPIGKGWI